MRLVDVSEGQMTSASGVAHASVVDLLLQRGASVNLQSSDGVTPLINATGCGQTAARASAEYEAAHHHVPVAPTLCDHLGVV